VKTPSSNLTGGDVWMNPVFGGDGTSQLTRDGTTVVLRAGESVWTPAGEATTWLVPVSDEQYLAAHRMAGV
jgi:hypothetical protein